MNLSGGPTRRAIGSVDDAIGASLSHSSTGVTEDGIGPTADDPVSVTCGALYRASRGSNRTLISLICSAASPSRIAMMKIPLSCTWSVGDSRDDRHPASVYVTHARAQEFLVEKVAGMRMLIAYDLDSGECAKRCTGHDVARPVRLVVNPGYSRQRRAGIHDRSDDPSSAWPPSLRFARDRCRKCKRRCGMTRRKRTVLV